MNWLLSSHNSDLYMIGVIIGTYSRLTSFLPEIWGGFFCVLPQCGDFRIHGVKLWCRGAYASNTLGLNISEISIHICTSFLIAPCLNSQCPFKHLGVFILLLHVLSIIFASSFSISVSFPISLHL